MDSPQNPFRVRNIPPVFSPIRIHCSSRLPIFNMIGIPSSTADKLHGGPSMSIANCRFAGKMYPLVSGWRVPPSSEFMLPPRSAGAIRRFPLSKRARGPLNLSDIISSVNHLFAARTSHFIMRLSLNTTLLHIPYL